MADSDINLITKILLHTVVPSDIYNVSSDYYELSDKIELAQDTLVDFDYTVEFRYAEDNHISVYNALDKRDSTFSVLIKLKPPGFSNEKRNYTVRIRKEI